MAGSVLRLGTKCLVPQNSSSVTIKMVNVRRVWWPLSYSLPVNLLQSVTDLIAVLSQLRRVYCVTSCIPSCWKMKAEDMPIRYLRSSTNTVTTLTYINNLLHKHFLYHRCTHIIQCRNYFGVMKKFSRKIKKTMLNRSVRNNGQGDNIVNSQNVNIFNKKLTSMRTTVTADFGPKNRNNVVRVFFDSVFSRCILWLKDASYSKNVRRDK